MAHPAKILEELKEIKPNASINHWIFGILHTSRCEKVAGLKGLLAVTDEALIFRSGAGGEEAYTVEAPLEEVKEIEADLLGTAKMVIHFTDGGNMEMSFISRGDTQEFIRFLKAQSGNSTEALSVSEKSEQ